MAYFVQKKLDFSEKFNENRKFTLLFLYFENLKYTLYAKNPKFRNMNLECIVGTIYFVFSGWKFQHPKILQNKPPNCNMVRENLSFSQSRLEILIKIKKAKKWTIFCDLFLLRFFAKKNFRWNCCRWRASRLPRHNLGITTIATSKRLNWNSEPGTYKERKCFWKKRFSYKSASPFSNI